jgi:hypothetical protein
LPDFADQLITELDKSTEWPLPRERHAQNLVRERRAFRRGDRDILRQLARWDRWTIAGQDRDYLIDPLPRKIAVAYADFLFGEDPEFKAPDEAGQPALDELVNENRLTAGLHRAERTTVSEGEVWWKWHVNRTVAPTPLIEWRSRLNVVPLFYGDRLLACAFITEIGCEQTASGKEDETVETVWRLAEVHTNLRVVNVLYRGGRHVIGTRTELAEKYTPEQLADEWKHGLPMLAGRIVNEIDDDDTLGQSDYDQVRDQFLALNEATTIAYENARLTAKDRVFVAGQFTRQDGSFDTGLDVFRVDQEGSTLGEGDGKPPIVAMEKTFDAAPLIAHHKHLEQIALTRVGLVVQLVGESVGGHAETGAAIKLRYLPTINAAKGKAREWVGLPTIVDLGLRIRGLKVEEGGFGDTYLDQGLPSIERADGIPVDEGEDIRTHATAVAGEIESRQTAIQALHPDWDETAVQDELDRIKADQELPPSTLPIPSPKDGP